MISENCFEEHPAGAISLVSPQRRLIAPRAKKILPLEQNYSVSEK
ncbi:MAG: hypothetical protein AAB940_00675 [Patescibacteria group bacterium]